MCIFHLDAEKEATVIVQQARECKGNMFSINNYYRLFAHSNFFLLQNKKNPLPKSKLDRDKQIKVIINR